MVISYDIREKLIILMYALGKYVATDFEHIKPLTYPKLQKQ